MNLNELKIGQIGDGDDDALLKSITSIATTQAPVLVKPNGEAFRTAQDSSGQSELHQMPIESGDLLLVGPHGEIIPCLAAAFGQRVLDPENPEKTTLIHLDAHYDDADDYIEDLSAWTTREYYSRQTSIAINGYIQTVLSGVSEEFVAERFRSLVEITRGDVQVFIIALINQVAQIAACIRPGLSNGAAPKRYRQMPIAEYGSPSKRKRTKKDFAGIVAGTKGDLIYSVDGDFAGTKDNHKEMDPATESQVFTQSMEYLLQSLAPEVERMRRDIAEQTGRVSLYTVSLDPSFCYKPERFLKTFVDEFYRKIMALFEESLAQIPSAQASLAF